MGKGSQSRKCMNDLFGNVLDLADLDNHVFTSGNVLITSGNLA